MSDEYKEMRIDGIDDSMGIGEMTNGTGWTPLSTLQDVAKAQAECWEIEIQTDPGNDKYCPWKFWEQQHWHRGHLYRGRPRQPKMKEIKMECLLIDGELHWRNENMSVLQSWIRQPHLDLIAKVPE